MIDTVTFLYQEWLRLAVGCGMAFWLLFLWKEWVSSRQKHFVLKAFVGLLAIASLVLIALQPLQERSMTKGLGILLTEDYESHHLDSLKKAHKGIAVLRYQENEALEKALDSIGSLYVLGDGLAAYDLWQLEHKEVNLLGGIAPSGIVRLEYDRNLAIGDSLKVRGRYDGPSKTKKLVLRDAGGNDLDSLLMSGTARKIFKLGTAVAVSGKYVYQLIEKDSVGKILHKHPIPVVVETVDALDILILNTSPTFETKYLKNFLAENGHRVLVRSQLTKERFKFENFNRGAGAVYGLTRRNLENFDLVILDGGSFLSLGGASKRALERAMEEEGLGVFIQPDVSVYGASRRVVGFRFKRNDRKTTTLENGSKVPIGTYPYAFGRDVLLQSTIKVGNTVLAAYQQKGAGRLGTSVLKDTYELLLDGHLETYGYVWSKILTDLARREPVFATWDFKTRFATVDVPFHFELRTTVEKPTVLGASMERIPLVGDLDREDLWKGVVYPKKAGWNRLQIAQDSTASSHYYTLDATQWQALSRYDRVAVNKRHFKPGAREPEKVLRYAPVNRLWLFVVFVLAMGFLWVEPRFMR